MIITEALKNGISIYRTHGNSIYRRHGKHPYRTHGKNPCHLQMLKVARLRCNQIPFKKGNADARFPYSSAHCDLAFAVDVMHHIENIDVFFCEVARILKPQGRLLIVTDSEKNIRNRSLTRYFPEALHIELDRYPSMEELHETAARAGLTFVETEAAEGAIKLNDSFISELEMKCSSALRLIPSDAHQRGMQRIRRAQRQSEKWISCYTMVKYERVESS